MNEKAAPRELCVFLGTVAAGTGVTQVAMVPAFKGEIVNAYMCNDAAVTAAATNFTTVTIKDGATVLGSWTSNTSGSGNGSLTKDGAFAMALGTTKSWAAGDTITVVKTDTGTGTGITSATVVIEYIEGLYDAG